MTPRVRWAEKDALPEERERRLYFAIAADVMPEPRRPFTENICALILWILMWINVFISVACFIGWTYSHPRMGFYAFNGSVPFLSRRPLTGIRGLVFSGYRLLEIAVRRHFQVVRPALHHLHRFFA